jgi:hypothetical protein
MSVRTRVVRLEGRMAGLAVCPLCRGRGKEAVRVEWDPLIPRTPWDGELAAAPPEAEGCPRCGKVRLTTIRVVYENRLPGGGVHDRRW